MKFRAFFNWGCFCLRACFEVGMPGSRFVVVGMDACGSCAVAF